MGAEREFSINAYSKISGENFSKKTRRGLSRVLIILKSGDLS
jgi:hypothetical protein